MCYPVVVREVGAEGGTLLFAYRREVWVGYLVVDLRDVVKALGVADEVDGDGHLGLVLAWLFAQDFGLWLRNNAVLYLNVENGVSRKLAFIYKPAVTCLDSSRSAGTMGPILGHDTSLSNDTPLFAFRGSTLRQET